MRVASPSCILPFRTIKTSMLDLPCILAHFVSVHHQIDGAQRVANVLDFRGVIGHRHVLVLVLLSSCLSCNFLVVVLVVKIFFTFPQASHPKFSRAYGHAHKIPCNTRLCLLHAPTLKSYCVPVLMLPHSLLPHNSGIHVREDTSASCKTRMDSCADQASPSEVSFPYLCPYYCLFLFRRTKNNSHSVLTEGLLCRLQRTSTLVL
mgnify:CR=1 FL=1